MKVKLFTVLIILITAYTTTQAQIIPESFYRDSQNKLEKDNLKNAIKDAEIAAGLDSTKARFVAYKAYLYGLLGEEKLMVTSLDKAFKIEPNYGKNYIYKAFYLETFKDPVAYNDSIIYNLDKGVSLAKDDKEKAEFLNERALVIERLSIMSREALVDFEKAHETAPFNLEYTENLAKAYHNVGDYRKSNEMYDKILTRDSVNLGMLNNVAYNHTMLGDYDKAIEIYEKILKRDIHDPYINNNLGFTYLKKGDYNKAGKYINRSIKNNKDNPFAYRNKAYLNIVEGNRKSACKNIKKAQQKGFKKDVNNNMASLKEVVCKEKDLEKAKKEIGL